MISPATTAFLRRVLLLDAGVSAAAGLLMALGGQILPPLTGLSPTLLLPAGLVLLPYATFVAWVAGRPAMSAPLVWTVIGANVLWAAGSVAIILFGWVQPTLLGHVFVIGQAAAVALFAELQFIGLRRARTVVAA